MAAQQHSEPMVRTRAATQSQLPRHDLSQLQYQIQPHLDGGTEMVSDGFNGPGPDQPTLSSSLLSRLPVRKLFKMKATRRIASC